MSLFVLCYDIWRTGDITTAAVIHPVFESDSLFPEHAGRGWKHFRFRMIRRVTVHTTPTSRIHNYLSKGYNQKCIVWRDNIELITIESFSNVLCVCECQSLAQTKTWMVPIQWIHTAVNALHPAKTSASLLVPASTSANQLWSRFNEHSSSPSGPVGIQFQSSGYFWVHVLFVVQSWHVHQADTLNRVTNWRHLRCWPHNSTRKWNLTVEHTWIQL